MTSHIVAHSTDPDGIIAHSLLERISSGDAQHYFVDYPDFLDTLRRLSNFDNREGRIIIADISLNENFKDAKLFSALNEKYGFLAWIDHHDGSIKGADFLQLFCSPVILASNKCASALIQERYLPFDPYAKCLADIAQSHDFQRKGPFLEKGVQLQEVIQGFINPSIDSSIDFKHDLYSLVRDLTSGAAWNGESLNGHYCEISLNTRKRKEMAFKNLEASIEQYLLSGKKIIFAYADPILYMKDAPEHLKKNNKMDYVVVLFEGKSNVVLYGKGNVGTTVVDFCKLMGGGGRGHGGGFEISHTVSKATYHADKDMIKEKLSLFFK